jgi:hypothetical protein
VGLISYLYFHDHFLLILYMNIDPMRLLNTTTLDFEIFPHHDAIPPYAILSHTWNAEEVTFGEIMDRNSSTVISIDTQGLGRTPGRSNELLQQEKLNGITRKPKERFGRHSGKVEHQSSRRKILERIRKKFPSTDKPPSLTDTADKESLRIDVPLRTNPTNFSDESQERPQIRRLAESKAGYIKIRGAADIALNHGIQYIWVDTCCINKESSAELTEAINSMFSWYSRAAECYAYLEDVQSLENAEIAAWPHQAALSAANMEERLLDDSRWFARGWTLQELIAPQNLAFYDRDWNLLGSKRTWRAAIQRITGVPSSVLCAQNVRVALSAHCIARKMSWAAKRSTTRPEDIAYCLMGIFNVNMPLLYGEGLENAYHRLQEEIMKNSDDQSLFAWRSMTSTLSTWRGLLAKSPTEFRHCGNFIRGRGQLPTSFQLTNMGLKASLPARAVVEPTFPGRDSVNPNYEDLLRDHYVVMLDCFEESYSAMSRICILVMRVGESEYVRVDPSTFYDRNKSREFHDSVQVSDLKELLIKQRVDFYSWTSVRRCHRIAGVLVHDTPDSLQVSAITVDPKSKITCSGQQIRFPENRAVLGESQTARIILQDPSKRWGDWIIQLTLTFNPREAHPECLKTVVEYERGYARTLSRTIYCIQDEICLINDEAFLVLNIGFRAFRRATTNVEMARLDMDGSEHSTAPSVIDDTAMLTTEITRIQVSRPVHKDYNWNIGDTRGLSRSRSRSRSAANSINSAVSRRSVWTNHSWPPSNWR